MMPRGYALLAEPDLRLLHVLLTIVKAHKLEPVPTRDGALARAALRERGAPTILITNLSLARLDGFALLAELREIAGPSVSAAVVISSSMDMRARAYDLREQLGIAEIVSSTLSADSLQSTVRRALDGLGLGLRPTLHAIPRGELGSEPRVEPSIEPRYEPRHEPRIEQMRDSTPRHQDPQRLARIANLGLVDKGPPSESLQRLVEETARTFGVPIALLSLVLEDRQWFKAHFGLCGELLESRGTPLSQAFCRHIV